MLARIICTLHGKTLPLPLDYMRSATLHNNTRKITTKQYLIMKHLIKTTLLLLALLLPTLTHAHTFEVDGIYYNINGTTATVTYKGTYHSQYPNAYSDSVTIPATVTYNGTTYSVTSIDNYAFFECSSLTSINIPNSVTAIGNNAFYYCSSLTTIDIPNSVISIGDGAFYGNSSLTTINIPNSVTSIGYDAFSNTAWYNNQPDGLVYAGLVAYRYKGTMPEGTSITLKAGTKGIAVYAFGDCSSLTTINIPNSVTTIGSEAFFSCSSLATIDIPNSVTTIGSYTFYGCTSLTNINIPNSVTTIGDGAFSGCSSLTTINIPNSVTSIGEWTFSGCSGLTAINIPNSVTTIGGDAFYGCSNLTTIIVASNNPAYDSRNNCNAIIETATNTLIAGCKNTTIPNSVTTIGGGAFSGCTSLTDINIPNSVTAIYWGAFADCSNLTTINIPNSVTYIGDYAFCGCSSLTTINIPNSVTSIGGDAFWECLYLNDVYCYATTPPTCDESFSNYSATLHVPAASVAAYFTAPVWSEFENIVGDAVAPTGIAISRDSVEIQSGEQIELMATVSPANASCKEVIWYSTDTNVATVEDGVVTAVGYGECDIFAYCMGMPAVCHITVANRISLGQQEAMLLPNHMLTLTPTAPAMPAGFKVTSNDPTVAAARVMSGKVQIVGIKEGTTTITVASTDGTAQPATCLVTVYTELGDDNCDGFVTIADVTGLLDYMLGSDTTSIKEANADLNGDGHITIADATTLIDQLLTTAN